ncbi:MAG: hypothetical protein Q8R53_03665 [Nanoarchaeota archaeon]|nr:hypothetical protein [Nanoarchaeota archaeon]
MVEEHIFKRGEFHRFINRREHPLVKSLRDKNGLAVSEVNMPPISDRQSTSLILTVQSRWLLVPLLGFVVLMLSGVPLVALSGVSGTLTGNSIFAADEGTTSGFMQWLQQSSGTFLPYVLGAVSFFLLILLLFLLRHLFKRKSIGAPAESLKPAMPSSLKAMKPTVIDSLSRKRVQAAPPLSPRQVLAKKNDEAKSPLKRWQGKTVIPLEDELALVNQQLAALEGRVVEEPKRIPPLKKEAPPEAVVFRSPLLNRPIKSILVEPQKKVMGRQTSRVSAVQAKPQRLSKELEMVENELATVQRIEPEKASWLQTIFGPREPATILPEEAKMPRLEKKLEQLKPETRKEEKRIPTPKIAPQLSKEMQKKAEALKKEKRPEEKAKLSAKKEALSEADALAEQIKNLLRKDFA